MKAVFGGAAGGGVGGRRLGGALLILHTLHQDSRVEEDSSQSPTAEEQALAGCHIRALFSA